MGLKILQFGKSGQVGTELLGQGAGRGHSITALGREIIDLRQSERIASVFSRAGAVDLVINGAAYTAVDKAESEPEIAMEVNARSVAALAEECSKRSLPLIHLSTDYVFDGAKAAPYVETDPTAPLNVYGRSKLEGENALRARHGAHVILRTSWVYSPFGTNFVKTMLRLGAEREELRIVDDQWGAPTSAADIAGVCLTIAERIVGGAAGPQMFGTFHCTGRGETTWRRFAEAIFAAPPRGTQIKARVTPITTADYPTPARRPLNSRLDCTKLQSVYGITMPPWRESLGRVLADLER